MRYIVSLILVVWCTAGYSAQYTLTYDQKQVKCLMIALFGESRGEPDSGRYATAWVIRNRAEHRSYPSDICQVVLQPYQFESLDGSSDLVMYVHDVMDNDRFYPPVTNDPNINRHLYIIAYRVYHDMVEDNTGGATHFWSPTLQQRLGRSAPRWSRKYQLTAELGNHHFHRM